MQFIQTRDHADVRVCTLTRPKANALNGAMVDELITAVQRAENDDAVHAVVFGSAQAGFFSAGFDVNEVFAYEPPAMRAFFLRFVDLYESLLRLGKPVIGALSGHTVAGGAFLALAFDMRVMVEGDYTFAVNEIQFGAIVPSAVERLLVDTVGAHAAARMILTGEGVKPKQALAMGIVDQLSSESELLPAALSLARELAVKPRGAFGRSKHALHRNLGHLQESQPPDSVDEFIDQWFSPECVALRRALTESLEQR